MCWLAFRDFSFLWSAYIFTKWNNSRCIGVKAHPGLLWETGKSSVGQGAFKGHRSLIAGVGGIWMGSSWQETECRSSEAGHFPPCSHRISKSQLMHTCHIKLFSNSEGWFTLQEAAFWDVCAQSKVACAWGSTLFFNLLILWENGKACIHTHTEAVRKTNIMREQKKDTTFLGSCCGLSAYFISLKSSNDLMSWAYYSLSNEDPRCGEVK